MPRRLRDWPFGGVGRNPKDEHRGGVHDDDIIDNVPQMPARHARRPHGKQTVYSHLIASRDASGLF